MRAQALYRQVLIEAGRPTLEDAKRVTAGVFHTLRDRLTPNEADHAAAQLPRPLILEQKIGALPVIEDGRPVGIFTSQDALEALLTWAEHER